MYINSKHIKDIKCFELNVNSLKSKSKQHELLNFIVMHEPDIMLLCETKLKASKKVAFKNYNLFRNDRLTEEGGGTAILIRTEFVSSQIQNLPSINSFEYTAIKVTIDEVKSLIFIAIYKRPSNKIDTNELTMLINSFNGIPFVMAGDFSCHHTFWGNNINKAEGVKLYSWLCDSIDILDIELLIPKDSTCVRANSESIVDLFITDDSINVKFDSNSNKLSTYDFDSDHRVVALTVVNNNEISIIGTKQISRKCMNISTLNWTKSIYLFHQILKTTK